MKLTFLTLCVLLSLLTKGQIKIVNQSLTDSSLGILYAGVENQLRIITPGGKIKKITASNSSFRKIAADTYTIIPSISDSVIFYYQLKDDSLTRQTALVIHRLGQPAAKLGNISGTTATIADILANTTISVELLNCYYRHGLVPLSYRFKLYNERNNYFYEKTNMTNQLSPEQRDIIANSSPGTVIILDWLHTNNKRNNIGRGLSRMITIL